jgi:hypothetical protein
MAGDATGGQTGAIDRGVDVPGRDADPFAGRRSLQDADGSLDVGAEDPGVDLVGAAPDADDLGIAFLPPDAADAMAGLAALDDPRLVLSERYVGRDRRRVSALARMARSTWAGRRRLLELDVLIAVALVATVVGAALLVASGRPFGTARAAVGAPVTHVAPARPHPAVAEPAAASAPVTTAPVTTAPVDTTTLPVVTPTTAPVPTTAAAPAPAAAAPAPAAPDTPEAMGAAALALIAYPWQRIPGYSIVFRSISDAPSPGFYGNTTFAWGTTGGVSSLYVYPGETVDRLAGITAFEIGHEVDAAYVEPRGGHDVISSILGIHPASWAPQCDCAEQGYLSGWYAAAFSDRWSPGVGDWSSLAPAPTGPTLAAVEPWLDLQAP